MCLWLLVHFDIIDDQLIRPSRRGIWRGATHSVIENYIHLLIRPCRWLFRITFVERVHDLTIDPPTGISISPFPTENMPCLRIILSLECFEPVIIPKLSVLVRPQVPLLFIASHQMHAHVVIANVLAVAEIFPQIPLRPPHEVFRH